MNKALLLGQLDSSLVEMHTLAVVADAVKLTDFSCSSFLGLLQMNNRQEYFCKHSGVSAGLIALSQVLFFSFLL